MRRRLVALAAVAAAVGLVLPGFGLWAPLAASSAPATDRVVVRPVTADGDPAAGFHVSVDTHKDDAVDCSTPNPSPGAVDDNIARCSPSAAYAIACWKAATPQRVLCSRDPRSQRLYSILRTGKFAATTATTKRARAPIVLVLRDGTVCFVRDGGAWSQLKAHPKWYGTYSCNQHGNVWSPPNAPHDGVDESQPAWTVRTSPSSGNGRVTVRSVRTAYYVGTHS